MSILLSRTSAVLGAIDSAAPAGLESLPGRLAALLLVAVWPANFYMVWQWRDKPWYLQALAVARLPLQIPLIQAARRVSRGG